MIRYDPLKAPPAAEWLALSEIDRLTLIQDYHRRARVKLPNIRVHAALHAIVENQAALGDETPVRRTLARLVGEGVDRHEAIHAVGSTLLKHMTKVLRGGASGKDPHAPYFAALDKLTVESWRREYR